jgi:hypothetical protein
MQYVGDVHDLISILIAFPVCPVSYTCLYLHTLKRKLILRPGTVLTSLANKPNRGVAYQNFLFYVYFRFLLQSSQADCLCGLEVRVPGYRMEMYCVSCEVRTEFIYVM